MYTTRIDFDVHTFVKDNMPKQFTVTELTHVYFHSPLTQHTELKSARQYMYRQLQDLVKRHHVVALKGSDGRSTVYHLSSESEHYQCALQTETHQANENSDLKSQLIEKIKLNKVELLSAMGETEAFLEWTDIQTELTDEVKNLYKASKDKTSKLLGKVSGYEKLLALYQSR